MKISLLPKSRFGTWSVGLSIFFLAISGFFYIFAELLKVISSDILIKIGGFTSVIAQIIAFFLGVTAVIKNNERSYLVFFAIVLGLVVLGFIFGDIFIWSS
ncbi:MAG: hypothetical protein APF76_12635 [Desulfitibacter sp. BRH_c19]|nr:MAG: hypothetical protein APF76_12635 [Desulfitibacter sp. BRH_c19]